MTRYKLEVINLKNRKYIYLIDFTMQKGKFLVVYLLHYNRLRDFYRLMIAASIDHGVPRKLFVYLIN